MHFSVPDTQEFVNDATGASYTVSVTNFWCNKIFVILINLLFIYDAFQKY